MKRKFLIFSLLFMFIFQCFAMPSKALADGMILPPDDYYPIYETGQKALIIYQDSREDLVISISFEGKANEFGWVVPLPSQPDVSKVDFSIFDRLSEETTPKQNLLERIRGDGYYYPMYGAFELEAGVDMVGEQKTTVEVLEEDSIGIFDYAVLQAEKVDDLKEWMQDNNYQLPSGEEDNLEFPFNITRTNQEELWSDALPVFQDYIDREWYFVTVKINNQFTDSSGVQKQLEKGAVDPLRFSFDTTDMIYPMELTGLSKRSMNVTLYVLDDHKVRVSNYDKDYCSNRTSDDCSLFSIDFATRLKKDTIADLTKEIGKGSWFEPQKDMYITKLTSWYLSPEQMDEDVLFEDTKNNKGVNDGSMGFWDWVQLPFVIIVYLPYYILGGFVELFDTGGWYYGYGYDFYGLGVLWFFVACALLLIGSLLWILISLALLKRTKKRFTRLILYLLQFPAVWLVGFTLSFIISIPFGIVVGILAQRSEIALLDGFCCLSLFSALLPVLFYRLIWKGKKKK
jgi:hypothetical protein